ALHSTQAPRQPRPAVGNRFRSGRARLTVPRIFDMVRAPPETPMRKLSSISRRRFDYVRMTGAELADDLAVIDMQASAFCRIFGANGETMKKWMRDDLEIPPWVPVALALLKAGPHMTVIARGEA